jgi:hypothetical protein
VPDQQTHHEPRQATEDAEDNGFVNRHGGEVNARGADLDTTAAAISALV